eukprot:CAMPEP_0177586392 /NCGR_PEP_ID=MMETSP0419_2-20121207/5046_1 /TAXON_ID=582737 /ORGANISM="Tetraselmis sp., Strain GSL018" /LENGTH=312 /DNA_ID=CAMNT_0019076277 /DNA_START=286 /DNA_END=1224 /DNA_ORIENTATION=+
MHDSPLESDSKFRKEHFTRSKTVLGYKAAGVLPYANIEGVPHALLGAERKRTGPNGAFTRTMWGDFGGHREASDDGDSVYTASREFSEETLGMFSSALVDPSSVADSTREMSLILRSRDAMQVRHKLKKGEYHFFVARTAYVEPLYLHLAAQLNRETGMVEGAEKTAFAWVPLGGGGRREDGVCMGPARGAPPGRLRGGPALLPREADAGARPPRSSVALPDAAAPVLCVVPPPRNGDGTRGARDCDVRHDERPRRRSPPRAAAIAGRKPASASVRRGKAKARAARKAQPHHMTYWLQQEAVKATLAAPAAT